MLLLTVSAAVTLPFAIGANSYVVTANDGAILREQPRVDAKQLVKLSYGTTITATRILPETQKIRISGYQLSGNWFEVSWQARQAYIFGPLVELSALSEFQCISPGPKFDLVLWLPDHSVTLCRDGSYLLDDSYGNALNSSEHGCYEVSANGLKISRRKSFFAIGIGKKLQCTHFCTYDAYRIESRAHDDPYRTKGIEDFQHFAVVYKGYDDPPAANFSIRKHNSPEACKRSTLFQRR